MKLNKKGLTLIELIISVVLVTVVMFFMYRLLNDVNAENNDTSYAQKNQINRAEILKEIEDDILAKKMTSIADESTSDTLKITFNFNDGTKSTITATTNTFQYVNTEGNKRKWTMQEATLNIEKAKITYNKNDSTQIKSWLLNIEVYTDNDANRSCAKCSNNVVDDIIISYVSDASLTTVPECLGNKCK